jgi:hypothetical protein
MIPGFLQVDDHDGKCYEIAQIVPTRMETNHYSFVSSVCLIVYRLRIHLERLLLFPLKRQRKQ